MFSLLFYYSCSIPMIGISISGNFFPFHSSIWWTLVQCWSSERKIHLSIKCWKTQGYTIQRQPPYIKSWYSIAWFCNGFFAEAKLFHIFGGGFWQRLSFQYFILCKLSTSCKVERGMYSTLNVSIGRFQKISILYHGRLLGFLKGRGGGLHKGMGGIYNWKSEGMGEFHRWDVWSRKCRVSSLKTLLLWTFVIHK